MASVHFTLIYFGIEVDDLNLRKKVSLRWYFNDLRDKWAYPSYFELNNLLAKSQFRFLFFS